MTVLILAGGFATRLWPLTINKAKPLLPVAGKPMISHLVEKIPKDTRIIVSTNAVFAEDFYAWKRKYYPERDIKIYIEDANSDKGKKGSLKAVSLVIEDYKLEGDLLVLGGDNFFGIDLSAFTSGEMQVPTLAAHDIHDVELAKKYGVVVANGTTVQDFQEKPEEPKSTLVSTLCYYFPNKYFSDIHEASEVMPDKIGGVFEVFLEKKYDVRVVPFTEYWNDIGSFSAYIDAHVYAGENSVPEELMDPKLQNQFEEVNYVEKGVHLENVRLRNSIVLEGSYLKNCTIDSCVIDKNCRFENLDITHEIVKEGTVLLNK